MTTDPTGTCDVCGKPGSVHLTEIRGGVATRRSLCIEHAPPEFRAKMRYGSHRTPAEEVAFLRNQISAIDEQIADPAQRAAFKAEVEQRITEIESGRRRLGDAK